MANQTQFRVALSGNHLAMKMNGTLVGFIQNLTSTDDYSPEPLSGIGDIHAVEYVPTFARYTVAVDRAILFNSSLMTVAGGAPDNNAGAQGSGSGTVDGLGLWQNGYQLMRGFVFDIESMGGGYQIPNQHLNGAATGATSAGQIFRKWYQCSFANGQVTVQKHQIVVERATFFCTQVDGQLTIGAPLN